MINILGKGGLVSKPQIRNYRLEALAGAVVLPKVFSVRDKIGKIKHQNGSSSCSSQATSYYTEVLNFIETGQKVQLSPKFLYAFVGHRNEGSYVKDNMARVCNYGIATEQDTPSYMNGSPPTEDFMLRKEDITQTAKDNAMTYWAKNYLTWDNSKIDLYKQAIYQGQGCVAVCWGNNYLWQGKNGIIQLPDNPSQMTWLHAVYFTGYDDNKKYFEFVNSWGDTWGDKGFGYLPYEYVTKGYVYNPHTLIDLPNQQFSIMQKLISAYKNLIAMLKK